MSAADRSLEFVDTNILIYAHDESAGPKHDRARQILTDLWQNRKGSLSIQVLQEFYVNVTQKVAKPLDPQVAAQIISELGAWQLHQPGLADVLHAIDLQKRFQVSFWDAMIIASATALDCAVLWSEDLNQGQRYGAITVQNPFK